MIAASDSDVVIVGGGPIGLTLALAIKDSGKRVTLLEARPMAATRADPRTLALSYSSRLVLERIGVWAELEGATPITTIHISQQRGFGRAVLDAAQENLPALGYVVRYGELMHALQGRLSGSTVNQLTGARVHSLEHTNSYANVNYERADERVCITTRLAVIADGAGSLQSLAHSKRRVRDYAQHAVVTEVTTSLPHRNIAFERFTPSGPAALLPSGEHYALIWTVAPTAVEGLLALGDDEFLARLQTHFGDRAGRFLSSGKRSAFPLQLAYAEPLPAPRTVLIGNAAQSLHPVAGQGINLGMRDAWKLAEQILQNSNKDLGAPKMLSAYRRNRLIDSTGGIFFTDTLVRVFSNDFTGLGTARGIGLAAFDMLDPLKRFVVRRMTFGATSA